MQDYKDKQIEELKKKNKEQAKKIQDEKEKIENFIKKELEIKDDAISKEKGIWYAVQDKIREDQLNMQELEKENAELKDFTKKDDQLLEKYNNTFQAIDEALGHKDNPLSLDEMVNKIKEINNETTTGIESNNQQSEDSFEYDNTITAVPSLKDNKTSAEQTLSDVKNIADETMSATKSMTKAYQEMGDPNMLKEVAMKNASGMGAILEAVNKFADERPSEDIKNENEEENNHMYLNHYRPQ